ncbi:MAG: hypothetical protein Unbinned3849contig1000_36 [Prokaryotic dsDNA virus sp.]|nr:MAG: hypothetical protein Unbinned3849contig1000_36 [Prokaryotic dsDNA virus sp.]|tara:strand:+ start:24852 stop:25052 length:201 start_codon:yes stop_codon:yes gene_type:complete
MAKGNKVYHLTIAFNDEMDEVEYIDEEVINEDELFTSVIIGNYDLADYWDKDTYKLFTQVGICGEA